MYCILVAGVPASGKTTYAKYIGKELGITVICKDEIKEILFDDIGFKGRAEKVTLGVAAMNIMYYFAQQCIQAGKPFILENNFENNSVDGLEKVLANSGYRVLTLRMHGDLRVIYQRFTERDKSPARHPGHVVNTQYPLLSEKERKAVPPSFETFKDNVEKRGMTDFTWGESCIEIDATSFDATSFDVKNKKDIVEKIRIWINKS